MNTLIAGGGVGGLATALSMRAAGFENVLVAEAVPEIKPLGVGINVLPHAIRELDELGLAEPVRAAGLDVDRTVYYDQYGGRIAAVARGSAAGYDWPQLSMHRGALQMLLLRVVTERLGAKAVRTGCAVRGFESTDAGVTVRLDSASSGHETGEYDLLVGADGIKSTVRSLLYPAEGDPEWNQCLIYRGVSRMDHEFATSRSVLFAGHPDQRFMLYPIRDTNGEVILNWGCTIRTDGPMPEHGQWNRRVDPTPLLDLFDGWRCDSVTVTDIIAGADEVFLYPMTDRDPLPSWTAGRVTLLGDAAHPMYPSGSNGTSQAILDARILARELAGHDDVGAALREYERLRLPATTEVVRANRDMADMKVMRLVRERAPGGFQDISEVISQDELDELMRGYQITAGFEPSELNARQSLTVR